MDLASGEVTEEDDLPAGEKGGLYAVGSDGSGIIWANEILRTPSYDSIRQMETSSSGTESHYMVVELLLL